MPKALTIRLDDELAHELRMAAQIGGSSVADVVRVAISADLHRRRADPEFRRRRDHLVKALNRPTLSPSSPTLPPSPSPPTKGPADDQS